MKIPPFQSFGFSIRQDRVAALLVLGFSRKQIADKMKIGNSTVDKHLKAIYAKTGGNNIHHAAVILVRNGW